MLNNIKYIIRTATLLALSAFMSCAEMEDPQTGAVGYLAAPSLAVDVTVHDISLTKAAPALNAVDMPSAEAVRAEVKYVVKKKGSEDDLLGGKPWTEALTLPTDETYVVEAFYGDDEFDGPCLYGSQEITIAALETAQPNLNVKVSNSLLCVSTDPLDGHFTMTELVMKSGDSTRTLTKSESVQVEDTWIWVPAGQNLELEIKGTNSVEAAASFTHSFTPQAGSAYNLISGKPEDNWPKITWPLTSLADGAFEGALYFIPAVISNMSDSNAASMTYQVKGGSYSDWTEVAASDVSGYKCISGLSNGVTYSIRACVGNIISEELSFTPITFQSCLSVGSVSAAHNNAGNADIELSSTTMTVNNMAVNLPATVAKMASVTAVGSFTSSNNTVTGSFSSVVLSSTAKNSAFTNKSDWPYLPQGAYLTTVTATCTLDGATYTAISTQTATVPAPVLGLTMSSYTSYDKYAATNNIAKDLNGTTGANNCDPSTLYNAGGKWNVSSSLMSNANYAKKLVVRIDNDESRTFNVNEYADNSYYENISGLSWSSHDLSVSFTFDGVTINKSQTHHITGLPYTAAPPKIGGELAWSKSGGGSWDGNDSYAKLSNGGGECSITSVKFYIPSNINISIGAKYDVVGMAIGTTFTLNVGSSNVISTKASSYKTVSEEKTIDATMSSTNNYVVCKNSYGVGATHSKVYYVTLNYRN